MHTGITIIAVGDIFLGDYTVSLGFGVKSSLEKSGLDYLFSNVCDYIKDSDIAFANLETVLSNCDIDKNNVLSLACRGKPEFAELLKNAGFNIMNIANNHILQHGEKAFQETVDCLTKEGIKVIGLNGAGEFSSEPFVVSVKGKKVGFLGYCFCPEMYHKGEVRYACGFKNDIVSDINKLKNMADYQIVSCHWGVEFIDEPSINVRQLARMLVDAGADVIFGHHPHVVQGIEEYNGSLIFYSLGNFVFDLSWCKKTRKSMIAKVYIGGDGNIKYDLLPVNIGSNYQPVAMGPEESKKFIEYIRNISRDLVKGPGNVDIEEDHYNYYKKAYEALKRETTRKIIYVMKNFYKMKPVVYPYLFRKLINKLKL